MAQPAGFMSQDNRTDMGIPVFWTTANSYPPWIFKIWLDQFLLAGPKVGHNVYYNEVEKRVASRLFLALGTEGKKKFVQKNPHVEVSKLEFREMVALAKVSFDKTQSVTYERYKLFNRAQETGETLEAFHAALTAQAAKAELGTLEDELVRDLLISKMKNAVMHDTLTFETFSAGEVLKRVV